jgi:lysophospholipase L1-like esterase
MLKPWISRFVLGVVGCFILSQVTLGQETLKVLSPTKHQVIQRRYWVPQLDYVNRAGGPVRGFARVPIELEVAAVGYERAEWRLRAIVQPDEGDWSAIELQSIDGKWLVSPKVPAGGWYSAEFRLLQGERVVAVAASEPFGVGEVFIVAGQSYATNCNDKLFQVKDTQQRVVCWDREASRWRVAHDPQPVVDGSKDGSIWPLVGDELASLLDVPIAFVNVAYGGTSSEQWLPGGTLHKNLHEACDSFSSFRGVLWQQGESDVIDKRPTEKYVQNLLAIRSAAFEGLAFKPRWWLAKSTLHPTVYVDPQHEHAIRRAYDILVAQHGFDAGPDTDRLGGENRGGPQSRRHFSEIGQVNAAKLWSHLLFHDLTRNSPEHWTPEHWSVHSELDELRLRDYCWSEAVVWNESSILMQSDGEGAATARLAFPAAEILQVRAANRTVIYEPGQDYVLSDDGLSVTFANVRGLPSISLTDLYKPDGAPQSYRHRSGHPEQSLLYAPGRWFHDRDVEITYRRRDDERLGSAAFVFGQIPKTMMRLSKGESIRLAISGDSISTGLDASATTQAIPNQFGYAELVAAQLEQDFNTEVVLTNRSVPGWSVANGVTDLDNLLKTRPNIIVVAYGMNDVGRRDPAWFAGQLTELLRKIKAYDAECEVIIVSPMLGNPEWVHTPRDMFGLYRDEMKKFAGEGIAFVDVTEVWSLYTKSKHFLDLTGNGLNHPNDYGHRLYAQALLSCFPLPQR